jgi:hypothetical protein
VRLILDETQVTMIPYCAGVGCTIPYGCSMIVSSSLQLDKAFFIIDLAIPAREPHKALGSIRVEELNC